MRLPLGPATGTLQPIRRHVPLWLYVVILFSVLALLAPRGAHGGDPPAPADPAASGAVGETPADPAAIERAFQGVATRVSPSVVGIRARRRCAVELPGAEPSASGSVEQLVVVNGSGTIVRRDGLILTNEHVVHAASEIDVLFNDGTTLPARVFAADARSDLAIVRVARENLPVVNYCEWARVARGQWTVTLGNPYGLGGDGKLSVSVGVISNLDRRLPGLGEADDRFYADMIQITAPIVPGNSGGPLFNLRGELIGIVTAMHTRTADDQGIGFAIPMTPTRRQTIDRLLAGESIDYGYIGITARTATVAELAASGLTESGVAIDTVEADGPAARAKLQTGDLITTFKGEPITSAARLVELVGRTRIGERVDVLALRGRERLAVSLTVEPRRIARVSGLRGGAILWRGLRLVNVSGDDGVRMGTDADAVGVIVIDVAPDSAAGRADLRVGDVIERVEDDAVQDVNAFRQRVRTQNGAIRVSIRGRGVVRVAPG